MPTASRPAFLRRLARGDRRWRGPELADLGTAFGLDQSLEEMQPAEDLVPESTGRRTLWWLWLRCKPQR